MCKDYGSLLVGSVVTRDGKIKGLGNHHWKCEEDTTEYLLKSTSNREHIQKPIDQLHKGDSTMGINQVTSEAIENEIASETFFTGSEGFLGAFFTGAKPDYNGLNERLDVLTICVIVLKNGFTFVGTSCFVDTEAFDAEVGKKIARERAVEQVWAFPGFRARDNANHS